MSKNLVDWLTSIVGLNGIILCIAALWVATWAYRRFGITSLLWLIAAKALGTVASLAVVLPDADRYKRVLERIQAQFGATEMNAAFILIAFQKSFVLFPPFCLMILVAGEINHFGTRLNPEYSPSPALNRCHAWRFFVGALAIAGAVGPSLITTYFMSTTP